MGKWLVIARRVVQIVAFIAITVALVSAQLAVPGFSAWLERVQFLPAVLASAMFVFVSWLIITLVFGRIYCSTVCPIATVNDASARLRRCSRKRAERHRYTYVPAAWRTRYIILATALVSLMTGFFLFPSLIDPYAVWVRFCRDCISWALSTSGIQSAPLTPGSYEYSSVTIITGSIAGAAVSAITTATLWIVAARRGRLVCNTVCPIGTTLGLISRYSIMQIDIDTDRCTQCRRCVDVCKSQCIDIVSHTVDASRCVNCFNCLRVCNDDAIHYTARRKQLSEPMMQKVAELQSHTGAPVTEANTTIQKNTTEKP